MFVVAEDARDLFWSHMLFIQNGQKRDRDKYLCAKAAKIVFSEFNLIPCEFDTLFY